MDRSQQMAARRILANQALFLATGVVSTLGAQWLKYRGAANSWSFMTSLCQFAGMAAVAFLPPPVRAKQDVDFTGDEEVSTAAAPSASASFVELCKARLARFGPVNIKGAALIAVFEVFGNLVLVAGMFLTGSGLYMVIYSSIVGFTAVFSRLLLPGRHLSFVQWCSVVAICVGLSLTAIGNTGEMRSGYKRTFVLTLPFKGQHDKSEVTSLFIGIVINIFGTAVLSLVYVGTDHLLSTGVATPYAQSIYVGIFSTLFTILTQIAISIPTLQTLPLLDVDVILAHLVLILSSLGHSVAYFQLVDTTGGVATGVLQGLRAVGVFVLSDLWFCSVDPGQCFSVAKGAAAVIVVCSVVAFAAGKKVHSPSPKRPESSADNLLGDEDGNGDTVDDCNEMELQPIK
ncbi:hypothetical protein HDU83_002409 [Entophlyctis luteolus]|nr:hypothetical protein HDU82_007211 [Entophlyctis luteolus]KAJ3347059.1 hypothetical protein HDU83_002409 [Entophlyctis luteolus]KAJ3386174.1 hypothetical protein HDU84_001754 [Entophlyctis sp. JEL0112]